MIAIRLSDCNGHDPLAVVAMACKVPEASVHGVLVVVINDVYGDDDVLAEPVRAAPPDAAPDLQHQAVPVACPAGRSPCERGADGYCARCHAEAYPGY